MNTLDKAIECFKGARQRVADGMSYLWEINEGSLWDNGQYSSFTDFCESGCGISRSMASKLLRVYQHYVIDGKVSQINYIDTDKLYLAIGLPGSPSKQLVKADTLTRQQIRDELAADEFGDCQHTNTIKICTRCKQRVE